MLQKQLRNILIVEDEPVVAASMEFLLKRAGFNHVSMTRTAYDAVSRIRSLQIFLAFVDYDLGGETSEPVVEELTRRQIPFVMVSGRDRPSDCHHNLVFLEKPFRSNQFMRIARQFAI